MKEQQVKYKGRLLPYWKPKGLQVAASRKQPSWPIRQDRQCTKAFSEITEDSLQEDITMALLELSGSTAQFLAHDISSDIAVFSWRPFNGHRYYIEAVWDGGPHITLFREMNDVVGIVAGMTCNEHGCEWPEGCDPAFQVLCAAAERME